MISMIFNFVKNKKKEQWGPHDSFKNMFRGNKLFSFMYNEDIKKFCYNERSGQLSYVKFDDSEGIIAHGLDFDDHLFMRVVLMDTMRMDISERRCSQTSIIDKVAFDSLILKGRFNGHSDENGVTIVFERD